MRSTLFYIPTQIDGIPLLGFGILLAALAIVAAIWLAIVVRRHGWGPEAYSYLPIFGLLAAVIVFILPRIAEPEGLPIRGFGVTLLLGVGAGVWLAVERAKARGLDPEIIYNLGFWMFGAGILGARAFYIIEYWPQYEHETWGETLASIVNVAQGGLVVYGSLIGGLAAFFIFTRRNALPPLALADLIAPSMLIGLALGRIGCFLNGCCFGGMCELPWAVSFPAGSPPYVRQLERGLMYDLQIAGEPIRPGDSQLAPMVAAPAHAAAGSQQGPQAGERILNINGLPTPTVDTARRALIDNFLQQREVLLKSDRNTYPLMPVKSMFERSLPVHPTQLYSVLDALLICGLLLAYEPFQRRDGALLALMLTIYPITRFLIEIIRIDEGAVFGTGMSISQNISLLILVAVAGLWWYVLSRPAKRAWKNVASY